jgi:hypothetical protein
VTLGLCPADYLSSIPALTHGAFWCGGKLQKLKRQPFGVVFFIKLFDNKVMPGSENSTAAWQQITKMSNFYYLECYLLSKIINLYSFLSFWLQPDFCQFQFCKPQTIKGLTGEFALPDKILAD